MCSERWQVRYTRCLDASPQLWKPSVRAAMHLPSGKGKSLTTSSGECRTMFLCLQVQLPLVFPTVLSSSSQRSVREVADGLAVVWHGTPRRRNGEPSITVPSVWAVPTRVWQGLACSSVAKRVLDVVRAGLCLAARSHPIWRVRHHRSVECCLAHAYACVSYAQTPDSPEEVRAFCTDPKGGAGSFAGRSLEESPGNVS